MEKNLYCCCNVFPLEYGIGFIAFHTFLHGFYGISLVVTSFHWIKNILINWLVIFTHLMLIVAGFHVLLTILYKNWKSARVCAYFLGIDGVLNLLTTLFYFLFYVHFTANALIDYNMFWVFEEDWRRPLELPYTFWHLLTFILLLFSPSWIYYSYVMHKYSKFLKKNTRPRVRISRDLKILEDTSSSQTMENEADRRNKDSNYSYS